jgi:hypothetical protein
MSVDVKDFRRFVDGKAAEEAAIKEFERPMLQQEEGPPEYMTGDPKLDKMVRVLEDNIQAATAHLNDLSHVVCSTVSVDMKQKLTLEYMLAKGMLEAYKAVQKLPAAIMAEQKRVTN